MYQPSAKRRRKKNNQRKAKVIFGCAIGIMLLALLYIVSLSPYMSVRDISVNGNSLVSDDQVKSIIESHIKQDRSVFKPQSSIVFFDNADVESLILSGRPEISSINISNIFSRDLTVDVVERNGLYVFCNETSCYSVDENGLIFREQNDVVENLDVAFSARRDLEIGDTIFSRDELAQLSVLQKTLASEGLVIEEINEYSPQTRALVTRGGTLLLIPFSDDYDETFSLIKKMLGTSPFRTSLESQDFVNDYTYINAQFGNKIFSCVRGEVCADNYSL